jgi:putative membrane protein
MHSMRRRNTVVQRAQAWGAARRVLGATVVSGATWVVTLAAHPSEAVTAPASVTGWSWNRWALAPLTCSALVYALGTTRLRLAAPRQKAVPAWARASFWAGWGVLFIALLSPVDTISAVLFSVHMTQHMLLMLVAAPLMVLGRPVVVAMWSLPQRWRVGLMRREGSVPVKRSVTLLTAPAVVWSLQAIALWSWHAPALFDAALKDNGIHAVQHASFFGAACLFWWSLVYGRYGRLGYGAAVFYVFTTALHSSLLGALLSLASRPWYQTYVDRAGVSALEDQQVAGFLMWVPAGALFVIIALALFAAWLGEADRRAALAASGGHDAHR